MKSYDKKIGLININFFDAKYPQSKLYQIASDIEKQAFTSKEWKSGTPLVRSVLVDRGKVIVSIYDECKEIDSFLTTYQYADAVVVKMQGNKSSHMGPPDT